MEKTVLCDVCKGRKTIARMGGIEHKCDTCHGVGYRMITVSEPVTLEQQIVEYVKAKTTKKRKKRRKKRTKKKGIQTTPSNTTQNVDDVTPEERAEFDPDRYALLMDDE